MIVWTSFFLIPTSSFCCCGRNGAGGFLFCLLVVLVALADDETWGSPGMHGMLCQKDIPNEFIVIQS